MGRRFHDLGFACAYACEVAEGLPPYGEPDHVFRSTSHRNLSEGLVIRVTPSGGDRWTGHFEGDGLDEPSGAYGTPSPSHILAVAGNDAYWVPVEDPASYRVLRGGAYSVLAAPESGLLLLGRSGDVLAVDAEGEEVWKSPWLPAGGTECVTLERIDGSRIRGTVEDHAGESPFALRLRDGKRLKP